jgi:hypothetical protein
MSRNLLSVVLLLSIFLSACASARAENSGSPEVADQVHAVVKNPQLSGSTLEASATPPAAPAKQADFAASALGNSTLVADGGGQIEPLLYPLDPESGKALPGYEPLPLGMHYSHAFSPDGHTCLLYTSPSPRDRQKSRMPSSA